MVNKEGRGAEPGFAMPEECRVIVSKERGDDKDEDVQDKCYGNKLSSNVLANRSWNTYQ
jgi:hypothetical protein